MVSESGTLDTRRLLKESAPVTVIVLFWSVLAGVAAHSIVATGLRYAGIVMALLYVVVRGVTLAPTIPPTVTPSDVRGHLEESVRIAIPAGVWFVTALLVAAIEPYWSAMGLPGLFTGPADMLSFVFTATGVATVLLYAITIGPSRLHEVVDEGDVVPADASSTADG